MTLRITIPTGKKILAKKSKPKVYRIKSSGPLLGSGKPATKTGPRKSGPRKRGPSKWSAWLDLYQ